MKSFGTSWIVITLAGMFVSGQAYAATGRIDLLGPEVDRIPDGGTLNQSYDVGAIEASLRAPAGAVITKIEVSFHITPWEAMRGIDFLRCDDFDIALLDSQNNSWSLWSQWGGHTDEGWDQDPEDDADIDLRQVEIHAFDGENPNQSWTLAFHDLHENSDWGMLRSAPLVQIHWRTNGASPLWLSTNAEVPETAPTDWSITPPNPTRSDVIQFSGPTDQVYSNSCYAEGHLGYPQLMVNPSTRTVELMFHETTLSMCLSVWRPTYGLAGSFGPLSPGDWTFRTTQADIAFAVNFTVTEPAPAPVPIIALSTTSLTATCTQGDNADAGGFQVWNSGTGTLSYSISDYYGDNVNWLYASPSSGSSTGERDSITVTYSTASLSPGSYAGTITIADIGASNSPQTITVNLTVEGAPPANLPPTAEAGPPQAHTDTNRDGSESVTLAGSGTDPDGTIVSFVWTVGGTRYSGPSPAISLNVGAHTLTLTVTDDDGATGSDTVQITISEPDNLPPTAEAGPPQAHTDTNRNGSESVTLAGSGTDPDGTIVSYVWTEGTTQHATVASPTLSLGVGVHTLTLTVTDDDGATGSDTVQITILAPAQSNLHDPGDGHRFSPEKFTIGEADQWITIGAMIGNDGEARSGEVAVDFYISPAPSPYNSGRIHLGTEYIRNGVEPGDDNHVLCEGRFRFPHDSVTDENHDYYVCWLFSTDPGTDRSPDNNKGGIWDDPLTVGPPEFTFSLTITAGPGGEVRSVGREGEVHQPGEGTFNYTETGNLTVAAHPGSFSKFNKWSGTAVDADLVENIGLATTVVVLDGQHTGDYTLHASFSDLGMRTNAVPADTPDQNKYGMVDNSVAGAQNAVNFAQDGAVVVFEPGVYRENLDLQGRDVTIIGSWLDDQDTRLYSLALDRAGTTDRGRVLMGMGNAVVPDYLGMPVIDGNGVGPVLRFGGGAQGNCVISGFVITGGSADTGAAIDCNGASPEISHCIISGNLVEGDTGACLRFVDSNAVLSNCTIAGNFGVLGSSLASFMGSEVVIANSILWNNDPWPLQAESDSVPSIFYCDIEGAWPGLGNFSADPLFALPGYWDDAGTPFDPMDDLWVLGDYHLQSTRGRFSEDMDLWIIDAQSSPGIDAGDPDVGSGSEPIPHGKRMNIGVYGGTRQGSMTPLRQQ